MNARDVYRRMHKPHIQIIRDEFCPNCRFILNQGHPRYYFQFGTWTEFHRSFAGICQSAKFHADKRIAGNFSN